MSSAPNNKPLTSRSQSPEAESVELIAAACKAQIVKLETCVQKQVQMFEKEKKSAIAQHARDEKALADMKARLKVEKKKNTKLQKNVKALQFKLMEARNTIKNIVEVLQDDQLTRANLKRKSKVSLNNSKEKLNKISVDSGSEVEDDKVSSNDEEDAEELDDSDAENEELDGNKSESEDDVPERFRHGNFVILKSDVQWDGDTVMTKLDKLNVFKIEGKVLLQKYVPILSFGKIEHKRTCVYTGWNVHERSKYYSITEILDQQPITDSKEYVSFILNDLIKVRDKN